MELAGALLNLDDKPFSAQLEQGLADAAFRESGRLFDLRASGAAVGLEVVQNGFLGTAPSPRCRHGETISPLSDDVKALERGAFRDLSCNAVLVEFRPLRAVLCEFWAGTGGVP